jgi:hypothetical protein
MRINCGKLGLNCESCHRTRRRLLADAVILTASLAMLLGGCSSRPMFELDELDLVPAQEELTECSLGEYRIPIPVVEYQGDIQPAHRHGFQLEFELFALVLPHEKSQITDAWERHEGKIRDRVIRICRNSSLDELQEPELGTLKARLLDALAPHLGENEVRQLLVTEIVSHKIATESQDHEPAAEKHSTH